MESSSIKMNLPVDEDITLRSSIACQVYQSYSLLISIFLWGSEQKKNFKVLYYLRIDKCL